MYSLQGRTSNIIKRTVLSVVPLLGLCFLPAWGNRAYRLVEKELPWAEAQSYCRTNHLDLATIEDEEQLKHLLNTKKSSPPLGKIWIGLYDDVNSWRWSLQEEGYYDGGQDQFRMWNSGEPFSYKNLELCATMLLDGKWKDSYCTASRPFFCYKAGASPHFIYVSTSKTWLDAQSHCRKYYTDLASVRSQTENAELVAMMNYKFTWIGLYRDSWKWSDGNPVQFTKWNDGRPTGLTCVALYNGSMVDEDCSMPYPFVCNDYPFRQVVKLEIIKESSLNLEDMAEALLEQIRMKTYGLGANVKLIWRKQPDGKVFHKKERKKRN